MGKYGRRQDMRYLTALGELYRPVAQDRLLSITLSQAIRPSTRVVTRAFRVGIAHPNVVIYHSVEVGRAILA